MSGTTRSSDWRLRSTTHSTSPRRATIGSTIASHTAPSSSSASPSSAIWRPPRGHVEVPGDVAMGQRAPDRRGGPDPDAPGRVVDGVGVLRAARIGLKAAVLAQARQVRRVQAAEQEVDRVQDRRGVRLDRHAVGRLEVREPQRGHERDHRRARGLVAADLDPAGVQAARGWRGGRSRWPATGRAAGPRRGRRGRPPERRVRASTVVTIRASHVRDREATIGQIVERVGCCAMQRSGAFKSDLEVSEGRFLRQKSRFTDWVTADGSSGYRAEPGRYHLYVGRACPWSQRDDDRPPPQGPRGRDRDLVRQPLPRRARLGLRGRRLRRRPARLGLPLARPTAPATRASTGASACRCCGTARRAGSSTTTRPTSSACSTARGTSGATPSVDLYPEPLRAEIDAINEWVYDDLNNGVYKAGFARSQEAYDEAFDGVFAALVTARGDPRPSAAT